MILRQGFIFAALVSSLIALPALASDEARKPNLKEDENLSPTPEEAFEPRAIRASIVNGVIDVLENTKRARIDLTWDILPLIEKTKKEALSEARKKIGLPVTETDTQAPCGPQGMMTITIANEDIGTSRWLDKLTNEEKVCLQNAFALEEENALNNIIDEPPLPGENATFDPNSDFRKAFRDFWIKNSNRNTNICGQSKSAKQGYANRPGCGRALIENITVPEYYQMLREYFIVTDLLRTKGIAYSLDLNGIEEASPPGDTTLVPYQGKNAYIFYQGIDWKIDIIRRPVSKDFNVSYYRLGARAVTRKPVEFLFRSNNNPTASIAMSFRESDITLNVDDLYPDQGDEIISSQPVISEEVKQQLETIKSKQGSSQLDIAFGNITGVTTSQIVSRKLLGGANNTSFIAGGLIGNDEIQSLVGANLEVGKFAEDVIPGLLFGLSPRDEDATLFLGPSLRFSIFTLAAGARLFQFDDSVRVRPAGVVSLDLSRVLNGNQSQSIPVKDPNFGGGWFYLTGIVAEDLSENIALIGYSLKKESGIELSNGSIRLLRNSQQCDAQGQPSGCQPTDLPKIEQNIEIGLKFSNSEEINFLPKGIYSLSIPNGYVVKDCNSNQTVTEISSLATEGNPLIQENWKVVKKENASLSCN